MTETVVHVTTLEQWKSVLDVWFKQGYKWFFSGCAYLEKNFELYGASQLGLIEYEDKYICCWINNDYNGDNLIEYSDFMAQQKEDNKMETYYVTQEQLDLIEELKSKTFPIDFLILSSDGYFKPLTVKLTSDGAKALLRYLGGDETIEFKVKEPLYRLWRIDDEEDIVYMMFYFGTPTWTSDLSNAFIAPLEEIKKWKTPAWEIKEVN